MTTQPLKSSLLDPTPAPVLGVSGAIAASPSLSKNDITSSSYPSNELFWQSINVTNGTQPVNVLTAIILNDFKNPFPFPGPGILDILTSTSLEVEGYKIRFQAVKLDGSEVRMQLSYTYGAGAMYDTNASNSVSGGYVVMPEFTISSHSDVHSLFIDVATLKVPTRVWGFEDSRDINPFPVVAISLTRLTNFYTTPMQPTNFDINVYVEPIYKTSGSTVPQGRVPISYTPPGPTILPSIAGAATLAFYTKNKAITL